MKNPYLTIEGCVERLYREYQKHPKLIVAVDFDGTCSHGFYGKEIDCLDTINVLKRARRHDFFVVVYTACEPKRWDEIQDFFQKEGIYISGINVNPIELIYGNWGKIYYNILLDDRAFLGGAIEILNRLIDKIEKKDFYNSADRM